jgi:type III restriction enzyme
MKELRLVSGYDILYGKVKTFITTQLFENEVDIENLNSLRNLSEIEAKTIIEMFKKKINELTVMDKGEAEIQGLYKDKSVSAVRYKRSGIPATQKKCVQQNHWR